MNSIFNFIVCHRMNGKNYQHVQSLIEKRKEKKKLKSVYTELIHINLVLGEVDAINL